jgi:hypothetical protein
LLEGRKIRQIFLKARQLGLSTLIEGFIFWVTSLNDNQTALIIAHEEYPALQKLLAKEHLFYHSWPPDALKIRPEVKKDNRRELGFDGTNSSVLTGVAGESDIGRSLTLRGAHLSEAAFYPGLKKLLASLIVHDLPGTFLFIESTANGDNEFKALWDDEANGYDKIFLSPICSDDYKVALPEDYDLVISGDVNSRYGDECTLVDVILEELDRWRPEITDKEHYTAEVLVWRRQMIDTRFFGDLQKFAVEYPFTAQEAFATSGSRVFPQDILEFMAQKASAHSFDRYEVSHYLKENKYRPEQLKDFGFAFNKSGKSQLVIFEHPDPSAIYIVSGDSSFGFTTAPEGSDSGRGGDRAAGSVFRVDYSGLYEVALWNHSIQPSIFAGILAALGWYYNTALIIPEANIPGNATIAKLEDLRYPKLYYRMRHDIPTKTYLPQHGFMTTATSKPLMIEATEEALRSDRLFLNIPASIAEMKGYQRIEEISSKTGKPTTYFKPATGKQDNTVMSVALVVVGASNIRQNPETVVRKLETKEGTAPYWEKQLRETQQRRRSVQRRAY